MPQELAYKIIANSNADAGEVKALKDTAESVGFPNMPVEKTGGTTALGADGTPEVILVLQYVGLVIATGFLGAMGADVWKKVKTFTTEAFQKYKREFNPEEQWFYNPIIVVEVFIDSKTVLQIQFPNKDEEFERSFHLLDSAVERFDPDQFVSMRFEGGKWVYSKERFKNQEQMRDEIFKQYENQ